MYKNTMAKLDNPEPVNLVRAIFLCNVFTFFFAASKACLFPFLTIFLKKLGLSASYTGVIIGCKTLVGFVFAPLWAKCAVRCGKRRFMLMFSIFMMALTYLSLTGIPSMNKAFSIDCSDGYTDVNFSTHLAQSGTGSKPDFENSSTFIITTTPVSSVQGSSGLNNATSNPAVHNSKDTHEHVDSEISGNGKLTTNSPKTTKAPVKTTEVPKTTQAVKHETPNQANKNSDEELHSVLIQLLQKSGVPASALKGTTNSDLLAYVNNILKTKTGVKLIEKALEELPEDTANQLLDLVNPGTRRRKRDSLEEKSQALTSKILHHILKREQEDESSMESTSNTSDTGDDGVETESSWIGQLRRKIYDKMKKILSDVTETEKKMFTVILVVLMVGEIFCSPVEKVADDSWYEFLESIDDLEKYGMHRVWSSTAFILVPVIVTLIVDRTTCLFGLSLHSFMLHFYLFGAFLGITFLLAFFFPMSTSEKYKYASKVGKGLRTVCCSNRGLLYSITLLIMGMIFSSYYNFLFWMLVDMGSKEITLGLCLTIAALAEIPMLLFNERLVKKLGNGGVVALSVFLLSGRVLYYSFLPSPWAVLPAELLHAFTHTATWWAILSTSSFNISPTVSRSIRSILSSIYFGIGFAVGSIASGLIYEHFGPVILFQAGAVMAIAWFPFLLCGVKCCWESDKTEVKYTKLLTSDNDSSDMEDDWLEHALKSK